MQIKFDYFFCVVRKKSLFFFVFLFCLRAYYYLRIASGLCSSMLTRFPPPLPCTFIIQHIIILLPDDSYTVNDLISP